MKSDNRYFIKEKVWRDGKYGILVTRVEIDPETGKEARTETFTPIGE